MKKGSPRKKSQSHQTLPGLFPKCTPESEAEVGDDGKASKTLSSSFMGTF